MLVVRMRRRKKLWLFAICNSIVLNLLFSPHLSQELWHVSNACWEIGICEEEKKLRHPGFRAQDLPPSGCDLTVNQDTPVIKSTVVLVVLINILCWYPCQASWASPYHKSAAALVTLGSSYQSTVRLPARSQQPVLIQGGRCHNRSRAARNLVED